MKTKRCWSCKETKAVTEFYSDRSRGDGLCACCKSCIRERGRRYREANKEKIAERVRRYQKANREKIAEKGRRYEEANRKQRSRRSVERAKETNARSLEFAHRQGLPWEDWEDEFIIADNGLTSYQKAVKIGRSYHTVNAHKAAIKKKLVTS